MKHNLVLQCAASVLCLCFALAFLNPFHHSMTGMVHMVILGFTVAAFGVFAILISLESGGDERELSHRAFAGRVGFLGGGAILLFAIAWQAFHGPIDPWLTIVLCVMIAGKTLARLYSTARL